MDPLTPSPAPTPASPYAAANPSGMTNAQLQAIIQSLLAKQQAPDQSGGQASQPATQPGQQNQNGPYSGAGNLIKGLMNPPATSILGKVNSGIFGNNAPLMNMFSGGQNANPQPGQPMNIVPQGADAVPPMPAAGFGAGAQPVPFASGASPDAMTAALMNPMM